MNLLEKVKKVSKSKVAKSICLCLSLMMVSVPVLAEGEAAANDQITTAMNTAIQGTVASAYTMFVGLIPVGLQIMSAFIIFKLGKKFFGKVAS